MNKVFQKNQEKIKKTTASFVRFVLSENETYLWIITKPRTKFLFTAEV